jgi:hypothetical protein
MDTTKVTQTYTLHAEQKAWLEAMAAAHALPDASKALRVLLDFAIQDGNEEEIFETIRCRHCG